MSGKSLFRLAILLVCIVGLTSLYIWNPAEILYFPRCPFLSLTGFKCPGCGTLRGLHALLHFHVMEALRLNPFMVVSIPVVFVLLIWPRFRFSVVFVRMILVATLLLWVVRNLV